MVEPGDEYGDEFIRAGDLAWFPKDEAVAKGVEPHECYHEIRYAAGLNSEHGVTRDDFEIRSRSANPDARRIDTGVNLSILQGWESLVEEARKCGALRHE